MRDETIIPGDPVEVEEIMGKVRHRVTCLSKPFPSLDLTRDFFVPSRLLSLNRCQNTVVQVLDILARL